MHSNMSLESLSTMNSYLTAHESYTAPPPSTSLFGNAGPSFHTKDTSGGNIINVAGDYHAATEGPTVTYPPDRANYAPTGTITRHFVGRTDELLQIHRVFRSLREANHPIRYALFGAAGNGKSQLALQYAERAYAHDRYSHVFYISGESTDHIREGLAHMLRLLQPSDYVCVPSVAAHEARRWLEGAQPDIAWLLIVDDVVRDSVDYLRTHLPRRNGGGDILFVAQSEVVAKALADEGHDNVLEVGPLAQDDAVQLLFKKTGVMESAELLKEARSIVERLGRLPVPIHQAASFAKHFQGNLKCLTSLLQEGQGTVLSRWDTRLTGYEHTTYEGMVQAQLARLASDRPQATELLKVLCHLDPSGISLPILVDGARLLRSAPTKSFKLPQFMSKLRRPKFSPSDLDHPLSALLSTIALQDELHNLVRCLQHTSLVRLETDRPTDVASNAETLKGQSSHILRIPDLVRKIVRGEKDQKDGESACFGMTVGIIVSAFVQRIHDPSLWSPLIKHITSLSHWDWEFVRDHPQARLEATFRAALSHAIKIIAGFDRKILERKLKTDRELFERRIKHSLEQCGF